MTKRLRWLKAMWLAIILKLLWYKNKMHSTNFIFIMKAHIMAKRSKQCARVSKMSYLWVDYYLQILKKNYWNVHDNGIALYIVSENEINVKSFFDLLHILLTDRRTGLDHNTFIWMHEYWLVTLQQIYHPSKLFAQSLECILTDVA